MEDRIAFLLVVHDDSEMAERLCQKLFPHRVFVHVDAKAQGFSTSRIAALDHVTVIEQREAVFWSSFPMVKAILALMRAALDDEEDFLRLMVISGADYPIRPLSELVTYFQSNPSKQDIALLEVQPDSHLYGLSARHWAMEPLISWRLIRRFPWMGKTETLVRKWLNRLAKLRGRNIQAETDLRIFFGSSWWAMTAGACEYILERTDTDPRLMAAFSTVWCPEEHYFQTIVGNSPFREEGVTIADSGGGTLYEAPLHLVFPTGDRNFGNSEEDFSLAADSGKFFARKMSSARNSQLLARIDQELT